MTEITDTDFVELFARRCNIHNMRREHGHVKFDVHRPDFDTEPTGTISAGISIEESDFDEIKDVFTGILWPLPYIKQLLLILWTREVKIAMGSLKEDDLFDFAQKAFDSNGIEIDDQTVVEEFCTLVHEKYIQEKAIDEDDGIMECSLTLKGKSVAEKMFNVMKVLISPHIEPLSIAPEAEKGKKRRSSPQREQALDKGIVKYFYQNLIKEKITRGQIEKDLQLGQGALSDEDYARPLMVEMSNRMLAAPTSREFQRGGNIELHKFYRVLYEFLCRTLKEVKKDLMLEKLQSALSSSKNENDALDDE